DDVRLAELALARADRAPSNSERGVSASALRRTVEWLGSNDPARRALARVELRLNDGWPVELVVDELAAELAPGHLAAPGHLWRIVSGYLDRIAADGAPTLYGVDAHEYLRLNVSPAELHAREEHLAGYPGSPEPPAAHVAYLLVLVALRHHRARAQLSRFLLLVAALLAAVDLAASARDELANNEPSPAPDPPPPHLAVLTDCVLTAAPPHLRARATAPAAA
ncbi:hypothetical protein, partial [Isoptericola sp. NPDC057391]|uniref:hypothetical protein n=1 Tax=Isoptericola sp. NPDC057391 TaxID=3346117 RepID=UPI00362DC43E